MSLATKLQALRRKSGESLQQVADAVGGARRRPALHRLFLAAAALALAAAPLAAQPPAEPAPPAEQRRPHLEGEAIGYLAVPALLVLVVLIGVLIGSGGEEDMPVSP